MAKKVSKFFRVGVEGDTCDGRVAYYREGDR